MTGRLDRPARCAPGVLTACGTLGLLAALAGLVQADDLSRISDFGSSEFTRQSAFIDQNGRANLATLDQKIGLGGVVGNYADITQWQSDNVVRASQEGDLNRLRVLQDGTGNSASVNQLGTSNVIDVHQLGSANTVGHIVGVDDAFKDELQLSDLYRFEMTQQGSANVLKVTQNNNGNTLSVSQFGERNLIDLTQNGDGNVTAIQWGNDNTIKQDQLGGGHASLLEIGNGNTIELISLPKELNIKIILRGDNKSATVSQ